MKIEHLSYLREIEKCKSISAAAKKLYIGQTTLSAIIKSIAGNIKGGGGGKPTMAQAGGKDASGMDAALDAARELLR